LTPTAMNKTCLTEGFSFSDNLASANGHIVIAGTGSGAGIKGEGHVLELRYEVSGAAQYLDTSDLAFSFVEMVDDSLPPRTLDIDYSSTASLTVAAKVLLGDLNGSGKVSIVDELTLGKIILGQIVPTQEQEYAGDINGDSLLDSADMVLIRRIIMTGSGTSRVVSSGLYPSLVPKYGTEDAVTTYTLTWGPQTVDGSNIHTSLNINDLQGIAGMDIVINFDPAQLQLVSAAKGEAIASFASWQTYEEAGQLRIVSANSAAAVSGSGVVADLVFGAIGNLKDIPVIIAKFKVSGPNGENLARSKGVESQESVILQGPTAAESFWYLMD
jgi:hypothetical protein